MLKRLYVHNYKCLVNFEINFDQDISLFLGANGSGKSTVLDVLNKLTVLIVHGGKVDTIFYEADFPRWLTHVISNEENISIEIDIEYEKNIYKYRLELGFDRPFGWGPHTSSIKNETLYCNNEKIFESDRNFSINYTHSGISRSSQAYKFQEYLQQLLIARINPFQMSTTINRLSGITPDFSNFSEWFAYLNEANRRNLSIFESAMRDILPGFDYFRIIQAGQAKVLQVDFEDKDNKKIISYYLNELSEGQKVLIALYALIYCAPDNSLICIDEPENFLALPEIQPWFNTLYDQCAERGLQVLLISHHPKIINLLANDSGYWFSRENNLTRIQKISPENESGLSIAELIERGWIYEQ